MNDFILQPLNMSSTTYFSKTAAESGYLADGMGRDGVNKTEDVFGLGQIRAYPFWAPNEGVPGHGSYGTVLIRIHLVDPLLPSDLRRRRCNFQRQRYG